MILVLMKELEIEITKESEMIRDSGDIRGNRDGETRFEGLIDTQMR